MEKASIETKPVCSLGKEIFQQSSSSRAPAWSTFHVFPPSPVESITALPHEQKGMHTGPRVDPTTIPESGVVNLQSTSAPARLSRAKLYQFVPLSVVFSTRGVPWYAPEAYTTESLTTLIPHIDSGGGPEKSTTGVQVNPPSDVTRNAAVPVIVPIHPFNESTNPTHLTYDPMFDWSVQVSPPSVVL